MILRVAKTAVMSDFVTACGRKTQLPGEIFFKSLIELPSQAEEENVAVQN